MIDLLADAATADPIPVSSVAILIGGIFTSILAWYKGQVKGENTERKKAEEKMLTETEIKGQPILIKSVKDIVLKDDFDSFRREYREDQARLYDKIEKLTINIFAQKTRKP